MNIADRSRILTYSGTTTILIHCLNRGRPNQMALRFSLGCGKRACLTNYDVAFVVLKFCKWLGSERIDFQNGEVFSSSLFDRGSRTCLISGSGFDHFFHSPKRGRKARAKIPPFGAETIADDWIRFRSLSTAHQYQITPDFRKGVSILYLPVSLVRITGNDTTNAASFKHISTTSSHSCLRNQARICRSLRPWLDFPTSRGDSPLLFP